MFYYWNLHLKLAFMFEVFKEESINCFELGPAHYLSAPKYSWNVILVFTDVDLKLISDIETYQFIKSAIRAGISMVCKGYAEGNNKFLKPYGANKPTSYIIN